MSHASPPRIPDFNGEFFFGALRALQRNPRAAFLQVMRECGDIGQFRLGPLPVVQVSSPVLAGAVLRDAATFKRGNLVASALETLIGDVLTIQDSAEHHRRRKVMAPHFQPASLLMLVPTLVALTERKVDEWSDGAVIDLGQELMQLNLALAAQVFLSVDWYEEAAALVPLFDIFEEYLTHTLKRLVRTPLAFPLPRNLRARAARRAIGHRIRQVISQRRAGETSSTDVLGSLLEHPGTDEQREADVLNILFNVFPTTASLLLTLQQLLVHPQAYAAVQAEVDAVLGTGEEITHNHLRRLSILLQAYKETQRLYPFVPAVMRQAYRAVTLPGGYRLPKGRLVLVAIAAIHRRSDLYEDPDTFDLHRFAPEKERQLPRNAYLPFADGPHVCLGNHYSLLVGPALLALLMRRVRFDAEAPALDPEALPSVLQRVPFPVRVYRRKSGQEMLPAVAASGVLGQISNPPG